MSTKRTPLRRAHRASATLAAWETFMLLGKDYFHDLGRIGLSPDGIEREALGVWHKYHERFMAVWREQYGKGLALCGETMGLVSEHKADSAQARSAPPDQSGRRRVVPHA